MFFVLWANSEASVVSLTFELGTFHMLKRTVSVVTLGVTPWCHRNFSLTGTAKKPHQPSPSVSIRFTLIHVLERRFSFWFSCRLFLETPHRGWCSGLTPHLKPEQEAMSFPILSGADTGRTSHVHFVILNVHTKRYRIHPRALIQISCFQMTGLLIIGHCWMFNSHELACWFLLCEAPFTALSGHRPWNVWRRSPLLWHCPRLWPSFQMTQYDIVVIFHLVLYLRCSSSPLLKFTSLSTLSHQSVMPEHAVQAALVCYGILEQRAQNKSQYV